MVQHALPNSTLCRACWQSDCMKLWNLATSEGAGVTRLVGSVRSPRQPTQKLRELERMHAEQYPGEWELFARPAGEDYWHPQN